MEDLISEYTATDLLQLIANKDVSSFEILQLCIKQYETLNPSLNAIVETNFEDAIKCSYDIDRVSNKTSNKLPFLPLPVGVKDLNDVRGLKTTYGSLLFQDNLASSDDDVVAQLGDNLLLFSEKLTSPSTDLVRLLQTPCKVARATLLIATSAQVHLQVVVHQLLHRASYRLPLALTSLAL